MAFWISETTYFLIAYGWHLKAINEAEKTCDDIVSCIWLIVLAIVGSVMVDIIEYLLSDNDTQNQPFKK